ncbi:MAG: deoxyribose-phosphate aldolase [Hyphomicrobiaceae bacterium]
MNDTDRLAVKTMTLLDLTNLAGDCDSEAVGRLCGRAVTPYGKVAAVCLWPRFVEEAKRHLDGTGVKVATVANFPQGGDDVRAATGEVVSGYASGADEVDIVIPYRRLMSGDETAVHRLVAEAVARRPKGRRLKAILETGELASPDLIAKASRIAIAEGADFIKTSTGKTKVSATYEAVKIMLGEIRVADRPVGIKPSGGIKTLQDAIAYYDLARNAMGIRWVKPATFRFGASGLLDDVLAHLDGASAPRQDAAY